MCDGVFLLTFKPTFLEHEFFSNLFCSTFLVWVFMEKKLEKDIEKYVYFSTVLMFYFSTFLS